MKEKDVTCVECYGAIKNIDGQMTQMNSSMMKIVYALIGIIAANIGTKYIGTPWYIYTAMYATMFSATFVLLILIAKWSCFNACERLIRILFVVYALYVSILRIIHYQLGTPLTQFEGMVSNIIITSLAITFIFQAWKRDYLKRNMKRRHDD